ncbi:hypothetical protein F4861DRAFT_545394 [Xylaria intraflava]|nr:hypothetical protein F4861DRAFT_545394 [Xylaria intraflava]
MSSSGDPVDGMLFPGDNGPSSGSQGAGGNEFQLPVGNHLAPTRRKRVLLSCHSCRSSKLKCDRSLPCGQCLKRGKSDTCAYAPRLQKPKPEKSMAARLKRLEGMVRGMAEAELDRGEGGNVEASRDSPSASGGSVVHGERATNYVGGTHFMAILEDLEDLKTFFEEPEEPELDAEDFHENIGPSELLLLSRGGPGSKEELLALLPEKNVMDRLMNRYFNSNSPSQHIIHTPTFTKQYNQFLKNRHDADIHWVATLFMILALGIFFSSFQAPHELEVDSSEPAMDKFQQYRAACGWALIWGKYSQPGPFTLQALVLYTEADFIVNRVSQTNCYLLCSTLIRLMLKMGLHRDPSKLPRISPYQSEMRRRMWHLAVQIDLLVSFHLGLPCMIHGIESDTALPRNLLDSDFDEDSVEIPPPRPFTEYTSLTYAIYKAKISRGFGLVARLSHSLTLPKYAEVMRIDARIQDVWASVPQFMRVKSLSESIAEAPMLVIQRFGLASLYQKSRCVLHRRYLADPQPLKEHDYSRRMCLEAAVIMLDHQNTIFEATKPGGILSQNRWFIASLMINDFLLADMVVALTLQQLSDGEDSLDWMASCKPCVTKTSLIEMLRESYSIWTKMAVTSVDCRKAATVVRTMLLRVQAKLRIALVEPCSPYDSVPTGSSSSDEQASCMAHPTPESVGTSSFSEEINQNNIKHDMGPSIHDFMDLGMAERSLDLAEHYQGVANEQHMTDSWAMPQLQNGYNWDQFDALTRGPIDGSGAIIPQTSDPNWPGESNFDGGENLRAINSWNSFPSF